MAHPKQIKNLKEIKLEYLPPNASSELQPLDQGMIHSFKTHYRKKLISQISFNLENDIKFNINLLIAVQNAQTAWQEVSTETTRHCFK